MSAIAIHQITVTEPFPNSLDRRGDTSIVGFDESCVHERQGRRVDLLAPERSEKAPQIL